MKRLSLILVLILAAFFTFGEERIIELGNIAETGWKIIPDRYSVPNPDVEFQTLEYENRWGESGIAAGFKLPFPETYHPAYYIIQLEIPITYPDVVSYGGISVDVYGHNRQLDFAILIEDNKGNKSEIFMGRLDYDGWKELSYRRSWRKPADGLIITGFILYQRHEPLTIPAERILYLENLTIFADFNDQPKSSDEGPSMSLEEYADFMDSSSEPVPDNE